MAFINKQDTDGTKGTLAEGEFGYDKQGTDRGRVYVGTNAGNVALATKNDITLVEAITATAEEINKLDGFTGTNSDLNYAKDLRATGVTTTEFDYLDGVTSNIQNQLNNKSPLGTYDATINTSGAAVLDELTIVNGMVTKADTRNITAADLGITNYDAAHSFSSNGYQKFSNGLILQWGQYNDAASPTITFPIAFPNYCASATVEQYWNNTGSKYAGRVRYKGTTSMGVHWGNNYVAGADIIWTAIGY